jgi:hypothetical protein
VLRLEPRSAVVKTASSNLPETKGRVREKERNMVMGSRAPDRRSQQRFTRHNQEPEPSITETLGTLLLVRGRNETASMRRCSRCSLLIWRFASSFQLKVIKYICDSEPCVQTLTRDNCCQKLDLIQSLGFDWNRHDS